MKRISIGKIILLIAMTTLLIGLVGCSDVSNDGKKAFKAVENY